MINVVDAGAVGDGKTDNTVLLNNLIKSSPQGSNFYFPQGTYLISAPLDFSALQTWMMTGDADQSGGNSGSTIIGNVATNLIQTNSNDYSIGIRDMNLVNSAGAGSWVFSGSANAEIPVFDHVAFTGFNGVNLPQSYSAAFYSCKFNGQSAKTGIGLLCDLSTDTSLFSCDFTAWKEGIRSSGAGLSVYGGRFEVNHIALNLGVRADGSSWAQSNSSFGGFSMEANDIHININNVNSSVFAGLKGLGTQGAPSGLSQIGCLINFVQGVTFTAVDMSGAYSSTCWQVGTSTDLHELVFQTCTASNGQSSGQNWIVNVAGATWVNSGFRGDNHQNWPVPQGATSMMVSTPVPYPVYLGAGVYSAFVDPSWNTTLWVSNKTRNSFTVNFGSPAPAGATIDWLLR